MVELVIISEPPELLNTPPPSGAICVFGVLKPIAELVLNRTTRDGHGAIVVHHTSSRTTECRLIT